MMSVDEIIPSRLEELLADRATQPLTRPEQDEFDTLVQEHREIDVEAIDRAAALVDLSAYGAPSEAMPASLRRRIEADGVAWMARSRGLALPTASTDADNVRDGRSSLRRLGRIAPWLVAAACLLLTVGVWQSESVASKPAATYRALADAPDTIRASWSPADGDLAGDIVWNNRLQRGVMRLRGVQPNDPSRVQYQLWIFDAERSEFTEFDAVDGGVFDVDEETGEVYIPVEPKLKVFDPYLFAITTEPPGGVVKHVDRGPYEIIATAPVS